MNNKRHYFRCSLHGEGEIKSTHHNITDEFEVKDISASGLLIIAQTGGLEEKGIVDLKIRFSGYLVDTLVHTKAKIVRKHKVHEGYEYALQFVDLSQRDKVEIDELVHYNCSSANRLDIHTCKPGKCELIQ